MFEITKVSKEDWVRDFSEAAHKIAFGKHKPAEWDRIDFALLVSKDGKLVGYATCRETDAKTLYWQFGGAIPGSLPTSVSLPAYIALAQWCQKNYATITTLVENDNFTYLKFAMRVGFKIIGVRMYNQTVLLEHALEGSCN